MAEVESNLRTKIVGTAGISALISTRCYVDRIDPRQTATYPFVVIRTVSEGNPYTLTSELPANSLMQVDCYGETKTSVNAVATAIRTALSGYKGAVSGLTVGAIYIRDVQGSYDPDTRVYKKTMDLDIRQNG